MHIGSNNNKLTLYMLIKKNISPLGFAGKKESYWSELMLVFILGVAGSLVFKPYIIRGLSFNDQLEWSLIIGCFAFFSFLIVTLVFPDRKTRIGNGVWTIGMDITFYVFIYILIELQIVMFSAPILRFRYLPSFEENWSFLLSNSFYVFLIGLFVYTILKIYDLLIINKSQSLSNGGIGNVGGANPKNQEVIKLVGKNKNEELIIDVEKFICAQSMGHYIEVSYFDDEDIEKKIIIRNSISSLNSVFRQHDSILRCHRSYFVNVNQIEEVLSSSSKKSLKMKRTDKIVPISRPNNSIFHKIRTRN